MPTYLTPGVYVEEVPSTSKPIEGVGTSIAAFVGLAPGGPVNTPMRISNWTQFAKLFGDPNEPDNGPFMEGAYLAHSGYGFFQNGGGLCWVVRVGAGDGGVKVEISGEPSAVEGAEPTYSPVVGAGSAGREEHSGLTLKKGRSNLATKVNSASKLIKIEETGASLPEAKPATGTYTLSA